MKKILSLILVLIIMLSTVGCGKENTDDKDKYLLCRRTEALLDSLDEYRGNISIVTQDEESEEWFYSRGNISARIYVNMQEDTTTYIVSIDDNTILEYTRNESAGYYDPLRHIYYGDVNRDGYKEVILVGSEPRGTFAGPCWACIYDIHNDCEIQIWDEEYRIYLADRFQEEAEALVDDDFFKLFPDGGIDGQWGELVVDIYGNMYYRIAITPLEHPYMAVGLAVLFLAYDAETSSFYVEDVLYRPDDIEW